MSKSATAGRPKQIAMLNGELQDALSTILKLAGQDSQSLEESLNARCKMVHSIQRVAVPTAKKTQDLHVGTSSKNLID